MTEYATEPGGRVPVAASSDLVVVGGGPAGIAAALAGARNGLSVTLLERYPYLGGLASGGMVLVLDDMCNGPEIAVRGLCADLIARLERAGVAASAGAPFIEGAYIVTTVFRLGGVNLEEAERFEYEEPEAFKAIDREAKRVIGGSWDKWWLKTPLPGVVWCNCPHMANYDGLKVDDLTRADFEGRKRIANLVEFLHAKMPGFRDCYVVDVAPQLGIRQTRLLEGLYVV